MKIKLNQLAEIQMGYSFRARVDNNPTGNAYVILQKDISDVSTSLETEDLFKVNIESPRMLQRYSLKNGDLLFRSRGNYPRTVYVTDANDNTIAASPLMRIRVMSNEINSAYLCWYLNTPESIDYFSRNAKGTYIPTIDVRTLSEIEIPQIPILQQEKIAQLAYLTSKEFELGQILVKKRASLREQQLYAAMLRSN